MAYDNELKGALFPNDKGDNDKRPDMRGDATINGVKYSISAWNNTAQSTGKQYMSLKLEVAKEAHAGASNQPANHHASAELDEIPF